MARELNVCFLELSVAREGLLTAYRRVGDENALSRARNSLR